MAPADVDAQLRVLFDKLSKETVPRKVATEIRRVGLTTVREDGKPSVDGFIADVYRNGSHVRTKESKKVATTVALVLSLLVGTTSFVIAGMPAHTLVVTADTITMSVTKTITICNQWGVAFYQGKVGYTQQGHPFMGGGAPDNFTLGTLNAIHHTASDLFVLRAQLVAFNYTNNPAPTSFVDASLTVPLEWYASWASNITGKDVGYPIDRNFTVSVYEILSPWKTWTSSTQTDGATWSFVKDNKIVVNRNPVSTVSGINNSTFGVGTNTHGSLVFNLTRAVNDWRNGSWNPANGLLMAMVAPWETTDQPFLSLGTLKLVQFGISFPVHDMRFIVLKTGNVIPEFEDLVIPVMGTLVVLMITRRRRAATSDAK